MLSLEDYRGFIEGAGDHLLDLVMLEGQIDFESIQVKNAFWADEGSLKKYWFNIEGDDCQDCSDFTKKANPRTGERACYHVSFAPALKMTGISNTSIAFYRCGKISDAKKNLQYKTLSAVKKAIYEYINKFDPQSLSWTPVGKSDRWARNPQARKSIYELMSKQNLFPDKFVSFEENSWVSRELYDKFMVPEGFPPIPSGLTTRSPSAEKAEALERIREFGSGPNSQGAKHRALTKYKESKDQAAREKAMAALGDPTLNPQGIKDGDQVAIKLLFDAEDKRAAFQALRRKDWVTPVPNELLAPTATGEVVLNRTQYRPYLGDRRGREETDFDRAAHIFVPVEIADGHGTLVGFVPASELQPLNPEQLNSLRRGAEDEMRAKIESPENNPHGFKVGDHIMIGDPEFLQVEGWVDNHPNEDLLIGSVGEIESLEVDRRFKQMTVVVANVKWDRDRFLVDGDPWFSRHGDRRTRVKVASEKVQPYNQANRSKFLASKQRAENLRVVGSGIRRHERALQRDRERLEVAARAGDPEMQSLINDPKNPERIKPGDVVRLATREETASHPVMYAFTVFEPHAGKTAVVQDLQKRPVFHGESLTELVVKYRLVGGRSSTSNGIANIAFAHKADERGEMLHQRAMARAQARTNLSDATGGRQIGDRVTVATGRQRGLTGIIVGWRQTGGYTYAKVRTNATESSPSEEVQVNVRLLEPVAGTPANEQNNPYSFENFLLARLGL